MPAFRSPDPVILKERFLARVRGLDQLNPADRCYAVRGMVRESWAIRGCDVADVFRSAWGDATGQTHWKRWFAEGVCRVGDFAEMIAVLATEGAENAAWRKIAVLCCLHENDIAAALLHMPAPRTITSARVLIVPDLHSRLRGL
jgi:hypothetical protein